MSPRRNWSESAWRKRLLEYACLCAEDALEPDFFEECVAMLARDYDMIVAILDYQPTGEVASIYQAGLSEQAICEYRAYNHRLNVFAHAVTRHHLEDVTVTFDQYIRAGELHKTEYYDGFLRPVRSEDVLALSLSGASGERTSITFYRGEHNGGEFDREDVPL